MLSTTPVGIRDLGPAEAAALTALEATLTGTLQAGGYRRVITPTFELAHVFERGLSADGARRLLRFVDPQNGEVLALRSDITPQIARLVCGPMSSEPLPLRLSYFGRVFRLRQHSEFQRREVAQAGVELIGESSIEADIEVLRLCDEALAAATGNGHVLAIGHSEVAAAALKPLPPAHRATAVGLIRRKDRAGLESLYAAHGQDPGPCALLDLYGPPDTVLPRAKTLAASLPGIREGLERIEALLAGLDGIAGRVLLDPGTQLGLGYYTGFVFQAYIPGVGQAVASGGRYDELLKRA